MALVSTRTSRNLLPAAIGGACVLALLVPARYQGVTGVLAPLAEVLVAPVSGPLTRFIRWVRPVPAPGVDPRTAELEQEIQELRTRLLSQLEQTTRLQDLLAQSRVLPPDRGAQVDHLPAGVLGASPNPTSPSLTVRAGEKDGVEIGSVATVNFVHLLGRVASVRPRACSIVPITSRSGAELDGVVLAGGTMLRTRLKPEGDGTLSGDVEDKRDSLTSATIEPAPGDEVRLRDTAWPSSAQMLLIGKVETVEPSRRQPLRKTIRVRPVVGDLMRVSEVVLHVPRATAPAGGGP